MAVQGHIPDPDSSEAVIGAAFNGARSVAEVYIDEGATTTEIALSRMQVRQFQALLSHVERQMEWHEATWIYARGTSGVLHLMKKGSHDKKAPAVCGCPPPEYCTGEQYWDLQPVLSEPWRTSVCKRCLALYDKQQQNVS